MRERELFIEALLKLPKRGFQKRLLESVNSTALLYLRRSLWALKRLELGCGGRGR